MKKKHIRFVGALFFSLWLLAAVTILLPARNFSQNENRYLSQMPVISGTAVQSGDFQEGLSDYLSDQVPFRSGWIRVNTAVKKLLGRREINGIYLGSDHRYFQKFTEESYSGDRMRSVFQMLDTFFRAQGLPAHLMLVPSAGTILSDQLPKYAPYYQADAVYDAARQLMPGTLVDLRPAFSAAEENLYYRTDHHWTTEGAELAYSVFAQAAGLEPQAHRLQTVSRDFRGTLDSRVLDLGAEADTIEADLHLPKVTVTYDDGRTGDSPYVPEKLQEKDQYSFFFGGNYGKVVIDTGVQNGRTLLVLKDSFANSFVPFLFGDYERIVMLDLRYYDGSVRDAITGEGATELLVLYEMSHFLTDHGILKLAKQL